MRGHFLLRVIVCVCCCCCCRCLISYRRVNGRAVAVYIHSFWPNLMQEVFMPTRVKRITGFICWICWQVHPGRDTKRKEKNAKRFSLFLFYARGQIEYLNPIDVSNSVFVVRGRCSKLRLLHDLCLSLD